MASPTTLIGRQDDLAEIGRLLDERPLVTLHGPGGIGKTRLAREATTALAERFPGGVHIAELSGSSDADDIASVVARHLQVESLSALTLRAAGAATLVVLDNCESALSQARDVAVELVGNPGMCVLATSRSPLYASNERILALQPLALPTDNTVDVVRHAPAVRLFLERATAAGARWDHTDDNVRAVGRLVGQLNGLPLAIELAAARTRALSPADLADLMERQLDLLTRPGQSEDRHHSLRTAIATSYQPLDEAVKRFFRRATVMAAPFDLGLAHTVAGESELEIDTLDLLTELVDASLIDVRTTPAGQTRYRFLDSIRAYGLEQLVAEREAEAAQDRYVDAVADMADAVVMAALESFSPEVLGRIRDQFAHYSSAMSWCVENDGSPARSYRMFIPFYGPTGARAEVSDLARRVRATWSEPAPLQAEAWAVMGNATFLIGDYEAGAALSGEAVAHPDGSSLAKLMANRTLGFMASISGDTEQAKSHLDRAVEYALPFSASFARDLQISRTVVITDPAESKAALAVLDQVGQESAREDELVMVVWSAVAATYHHVLLGDLAAAQRAAEAAVAVADNAALSWSVSTAHRVLGSVKVAHHGWLEAAPHFRRALDATVSVGDVEGAAMLVRAAAGGAWFLNDAELAAALWACVPPVGGLPVIPSIFAREIRELEAGFGLPTPIDNATLVQNARRLLGPDLLGPDGAAAGRLPAPTTTDSDSAATDESTAEATGPGDTMRFDGYELDMAMLELRKDGERVHIEPQVFDVLRYLAERRGTVVTKEELMDEVWGDRFVSESALSSRIKSARAATGDNGKAQRVIRTVHGKGFTFVAEIG